MRISGGVLKGRVLHLPAGAGLRPTTERNRQMVFNILREAVEGARFCDAYAGSGAVGIEALSRGAKEALFLERDLRLVRALRENLRALGLDGRARVFRADAEDPAAFRTAGAQDIVFLDPPYETRPARALERAGACLAERGLLVYEHGARTASPPVSGLAVAQERRAGDASFTFYRKAGPDALS
jgi:16S rRNA (guanine966-N2)-methyltransferase